MWIFEYWNYALVTLIYFHHADSVNHRSRWILRCNLGFQARVIYKVSIFLICKVRAYSIRIFTKNCKLSISDIVSSFQKSPNFEYLHCSFFPQIKDESPRFLTHIRDCTIDLWYEVLNMYLFCKVVCNLLYFYEH